MDEKFKSISEEQTDVDDKGNFNKSIMARIDKNFIPSPSTITCVLEINGTSYKKKRYFIYYESEGQKESKIGHNSGNLKGGVKKGNN